MTGVPNIDRTTGGIPSPRIARHFRRGTSAGVVIAAATFVSGCAMGAPEAEWQEAFPTFAKHEIAEFNSGYYTTSFDVDRDGLLDIVALSTGGSALVWYKNPTWDPYTITTGTGRFIHMAPHDIDGDGDLDLAIASEFNLGNSNEGGMVHWAEAPDDPTTNQEWTLREIDAVPTSHRLKWGDIDGDGTDELINLPIIGIGAAAPEYVGASQLKAYTVPADPTEAWEQTILNDTRLELAHGFTVLDWDGDGADDILAASGEGVTLFTPATGDEPRRIGTGLEADRPNRGSSEVSVGMLGDERFIGTIDPWHGADAVVYRSSDGMGGAGSMWDRTVVGSGIEGGHGLAVADLDGDGFDEVIAGGRSGDRLLLIFRYRPDTDSWDRIELDPGGVAVSSVEVHDINDDGLPDVLAIGSSTDNVVWFENQGSM